MNESQSLFFLKLSCARIGVVVGITMQNHLTAKCLDRVDFDAWRGDWHDDNRAYAFSLCSERDTLRVIAGRAADNAGIQCFLRQC